MGVITSPIEKIGTILLVEVISSIGTTEFLPAFFRLLERFFAATGCAIFEIGTDNIAELESAGVNPAQFCADRDEREMFRIEIGETSRVGLDQRHGTSVWRRVMICGDFEGRRVGLLINTAHESRFSEASICAIDVYADALLSLILKHQGIKDREARVARSVTSLHEVESSILTAQAALSKREAEVCARIVYGLTTADIALDLGVGVESVATYRKRAYRRMGIATHRELLCWYLDLRARGTSGPSRVSHPVSQEPIRLAVAG